MTIRVLGTWVSDAGYHVHIEDTATKTNYVHPHTFSDKTDAAVFAGKVALRGTVDLTKWTPFSGKEKVE